MSHYLVGFEIEIFQLALKSLSPGLYFNIYKHVLSEKAKRPSVYYADMTTAVTQMP